MPHWPAPLRSGFGFEFVGHGGASPPLVREVAAATGLKCRSFQELRTDFLLRFLPTQPRRLYSALIRVAVHPLYNRRMFTAAGCHRLQSVVDGAKVGSAGFSRALPEMA